MDSGDDLAMMSHKEVMQTRISEAWERLISMWLKFGYEKDQYERRQKAVVKHVSEMLEEMLLEAQDSVNDQQLKLDGMMKEIMQLAKDLSIAEVPELAAASGKTLLEMEEIFSAIASELKQRKAKRMEKYDNINAQVHAVCDELCEIPMKIEFEGIPADSEVFKLEQHLGYLHHEKSRRLQEFHTFRKSICGLLDLLERSPRNQLEQFLMNSNDEINSSHPVSEGGIKALSLDVLGQLEETDSRLKAQVEEDKVQGETYWQKIRELWSRLNVDEELIIAFSRVHQPMSNEKFGNIYKRAVLKGLQRELERLEEEKRLNMGLFIKQVREELCELWLSNCFMTSIEDRFIESNYLGLTPFTIVDFNADLPTEELLEKHEREVEYWRSFVERNKKIIDMVNKRGHMFAEYKTLDQKSDDPSRLANRGGALLKEEKERKKLEKTIPKIEAELKSLCEVFEQSADDGNGMTKFLVYARTINEMIEQDWGEFHEEKRLRKEAKKNPKDSATLANNKTLMTTQAGNPGSRKRPAPTTPSSVRGIVTPSKKNRTTALTPGKTLQSPGFAYPSAPSSSNKRALTVKQKPSRLPRLNLSTSSLKSRSILGQHFRPTYKYTTSGAKRRSTGRNSIKRKSNRNKSSLNSTTQNSRSSGSSSSNEQISSLSQPNLQVNSLEQLNFSEVIRGQGPIAAVAAAAATKHQTPKRAASKENFLHPLEPVTRSGKKAPTGITPLTRQGSAAKIALPTKLTGKEQVPPPSKNGLKDKAPKDKMASPDASYSEFTDHLLHQSTLNSTHSQNKQTPGTVACPVTPTKSGMCFTPAKILDNNCF